MAKIEPIPELDEVSMETSPTELTIDDAMDQSGSLHRIQLFYVIFFSSTVGYCFYESTLTVFTGDSPSWKCKDNSSSEFCRHNYKEIFSSVDVNYSQRCRLERREWIYVEDNV